MLLGVLGCTDFTMSLSKNMMWHVFIGWYKSKGLHPILIEFNLKLKTPNVLSITLCTLRV